MANEFENLAVLYSGLFSCVGGQNHTHFALSIEIDLGFQQAHI